MKNKQTIKTIFMGTADFAIPSLKSILNDSRFDVVAVFTQPDKPIGRSSKLQETPIKKLAIKNGIPVYQPENISDFSSYSSNNKFPILDVDVIIVVSYAQIIPKTILDIPKYACINVHGSLLPKYRGSSCIQASILNGDNESGATIMLMDEKMDTGDVLRQAKTDLSPKETTASLFNKISQIGADILPSTVFDFVSGNIKPEPQDNSKKSIVKKTIKENGRIDWSMSANHIEKQIRAMTTWPGAWTKLDAKILKILEADIASEEFPKKNIAELFTENKNLYVKCGKGTLLLKLIQIEGKKAIKGVDFINGNKNLLGTSLK
ncbi:methionyl-tRNA formyltransferase [Candidatus Parcubacteria bacterium]|mgnify:CR=1 FL=1|nr:MAG: methionyl-tRNA formyltransferase [Candidatus Parcubacteria bacterium]